MAWIQPKTNWKDTDYFNLSPDYERIRGNIVHLQGLAQQLYPNLVVIEMEQPDITGYPTQSFLNNVVDNVQALADASFTPIGYKAMVRYQGNAPGWDAAALNIIENNILLLYSMVRGQDLILTKMPFELGGSEF